MIRARDDSMGCFAVQVELANDIDVVESISGHLSQDKVRRLMARGIVDTGATRLVIPEKIAVQLGLQQSGEVEVRYADGRKGRRALAPRVQLTYGGRSGIFTAIIEPGRETALIGAIVLEELDYIVDCVRQELVPRDPERIIAEVEWIMVAIRCDVCGAKAAKERQVTRSYGKGASLLVIQNIPMVSCPTCGESDLTAQTLHEIERIKVHRKPLSKKRSVAVAAFPRL